VSIVHGLIIATFAAVVASGIITLLGMRQRDRDSSIKAPVFVARDAVNLSQVRRCVSNGFVTTFDTQTALFGIQQCERDSLVSTPMPLLLTLQAAGDGGPAHIHCRNIAVQNDRHVCN